MAADDPGPDAPPLVLSLAETTAAHTSLIGQKAASLSLLRREGLPVPDAFCVTTCAMRRFIREGGLTERLGAILQRVRAQKLDVKESWEFLGETRQILAETPLPPPIRDAIQRAYTGGLGGGVVAVRSSGTQEDLEGASFAGQYESFLNVRGLSFLTDAIRRCWASIWRNRVLVYSGRGEVDPQDLTLGVLVQKQVKARASGVLFTVNPLTGADQEMLCEATLGLGETLVSGRVNPDRFVLSGRDGAVMRREVGTKGEMLRPRASRDSLGDSWQGLDDEPTATDEGARAEEAVSEADLRALCDLGRRVQAVAGRPMDCEWALAAGETAPWLVQARPVTRLRFGSDIGEWTNANFKDGGVASDVCPPFMVSIYDRVFSETMDAWLAKVRLKPLSEEVDWLRVFYARPYWNVGAVKRALLKVPGFTEREFDDDLGLKTTYEGPGRHTPVTLRTVLRAVPTVLGLLSAYRERLRQAMAYVAPFLERYRALRAVELDALDRPALLAHFREVTEDLHYETETAYFSTVYAVSNSKIDFKAIFDQVNRRAGGTLRYLPLVGGLVDVAHLRPQKELFALASAAGDGEGEGAGGGDGSDGAGDAPPDLRGFLSRWEYHATRELDIRSPRWGEDPSYLEETVRLFRRASLPDPAEREAEQRAVYEAERRRIGCAFRGPGLWFRWVLRWRFWRALRRLRAYAWWREELRDCSIRAYWLVRRAALALGRRLAEEEALARPDDVFLLTPQDLAALAGGTLPPETARARIEDARSYLEAFRRFTPPPEVGGRHRFEAPVRRPGEEAGALSLSGVPGSPGSVRGRVRVVKRLEQAGEVQRGEVLVTVFTDPGWTPLMALAGALVTETGGLLSHAAVISREFGIPAVLACEDATSRLCSGDEVVVDGEAGTVLRLAS